MWKFRSVIVFGVLVAVLVAGASVAYGKWWWNAELDVEGTSVKTQWRVVGDPRGAENYDAEIEFSVPPGANVEVLSQTPNETVEVRTSSILDCRRRGMEAVVTYDIEAGDDARGSHVRVSVIADDRVAARGGGRSATPYPWRWFYRRPVPGTTTGPDRTVTRQAPAPGGLGDAGCRACQSSHDPSHYSSRFS